MKKILAFVLAAVMMLSFAACAGNENAENGGETAVNSVEGTPEEIIEKIYEEMKSTPQFALMSMNLADVDEEAFPMFTGLSDSSKIKEGAVSETMIGSLAYSMVVVRLNDAAEAEAVATEMVNGIDTRKWICVEADDLAVAAYGDVVMLYMVDSEFGLPSENAIAAFNAVCGGEAKVYTK